MEGSSSVDARHPGCRLIRSCAWCVVPVLSVATRGEIFFRVQYGLWLDCCCHLLLVLGLTGRRREGVRRSGSRRRKGRVRVGVPVGVCEGGIRPGVGAFSDQCRQAAARKEVFSGPGRAEKERRRAIRLWMARSFSCSSGPPVLLCVECAVQCANPTSTSVCKVKQSTDCLARKVAEDVVRVGGVVSAEKEGLH